MNIKIERINHMIMEEVSKILMLEVKDERFKFVTVTDCDTSNDLSYSKIYVTVLDQEKKDSIGENSNYDIYPELDNNGLIYEMKFISKFDNTPNRELSDTINSYLWLDNNNFLYSKKGKGMYVYNLETGTVRRILTGTEDYELKGFENGILKYDDTEIEFQY